MKRIAIFILLIFFLSSAAVIDISAAEQPRPVKARIVADVTAVKPGVPFKFGVLFDLDPHWHIYWKNPGDSGLPTSVVFSLPQGFTATDLGWPVPTLLKGAGNLTDYGYEDSLLLQAGVTPPPDLKPGTAAKFTARVSWVSCRDICIPGRAELELELPVSKSAENANNELFSEWRARLPVNRSGRKPPFEIDSKTAARGENEYSVVILLDPGDSVNDIGLYPVPGDSFVVSDIEAGTDKESGKRSLVFNVRALAQRGSPGNELETLIVYTDKSGKRSGYEFPVALSH